MLKVLNIKTFIVSILCTGCFFISSNSNAQNADINLLRDINPQDPKSFVWRGLTHSSYPLTIAAPIGLWVDGKIEHNKKTQFNAYELGGAIVLSAGATALLKIIVDRPRPFEKYSGVYPYKYETDFSFPSGHTSAAFATATSLSLEYKKWYIVVPAYAWAFGVGYSRVYLGEHYPTDVVGGAITGAGSALISHWVSKKIFK